MACGSDFFMKCKTGYNFVNPDPAPVPPLLCHKASRSVQIFLIRFAAVATETFTILWQFNFKSIFSKNCIVWDLKQCGNSDSEYGDVSLDIQIWCGFVSAAGFMKTVEFPPIFFFHFNVCLHFTGLLYIYATFSLHYGFRSTAGTRFFITSGRSWSAFSIK